MGRSRNQRSRSEGTFLEGVQTLLMSVVEDMKCIKLSIDEISKQQLHSSLHPFCGVPAAYYSSYWAENFPQTDHVSDEHSWNVLAKEFAPLAAVDTGPSYSKIEMLKFRSAIDDVIGQTSWTQLAALPSAQKIESTQTIVSPLDKSAVVEQLIVLHPKPTSKTYRFGRRSNSTGSNSWQRERWQGDRGLEDNDSASRDSNVDRVEGSFEETCSQLDCSTPYGWPVFSETQVIEFQDWYATRLRQRADMLQRELPYCVNQARKAKARCDTLTCNYIIDHVHNTLEVEASALGSKEDLRREAWNFLKVT